MTPAPTIGGFLAHTGAEFRVFDLGRRIGEIDRAAFAEFEAAAAPYPLPLARSAWVGVLFWDREQPGDPLVWFLRLPLDEQGLLLQAGRDDFLGRVLARVGEGMRGAGSAGQPEATLADNPYAFRPRAEHLAVFHAKAGRGAGAPPSRFYAHAMAYLDGSAGFEQWAFVGYQGLADVVARAEDDGNARRLRRALPRLPDAPLAALCACLEHGPVAPEMAGMLAERIERELSAPASGTPRLAALVRALGASESAAMRDRSIRAVLASAAGADPEVLAAIAARAWESLHDDAVRRAFLERLAARDDGHALFNAVVADVIFVPGMREPLMRSFRDPARGPALAAAVGALFAAYSG